MLDANAAVPLYAQLEQKIESQIANRALHPGDRLPTEAQLARENGISVITVRKAIDGLVRKGLLECKQGKGTFVSHHKLQRNMKKLQSFSDMCRQMGMKPGARMVENHLVPASAPIARRLGVDAGSSVIYISRLRLADGVPVQIEKSYFPLSYAFLLEAKFDDNSLFDYLRKSRGVWGRKLRKKYRGLPRHQGRGRPSEHSKRRPSALRQKHRLRCKRAGALRRCADHQRRPFFLVCL